MKHKGTLLILQLLHQTDVVSVGDDKNNHYLLSDILYHDPINQIIVCWNKPNLHEYKLSK